MVPNESRKGPRLCGSLDLQRLIDDVGAALAKRNETLAVGETSAGGALATLIHGDPAHTEWFLGGIVLYAGSEAPLAEGMRDVAREFGVVSEEYVGALAQYMRRTFACQWTLAESGIAGPQTGRRSAKAAGTVCLAVAGPEVAGDLAQERRTSPRATEELGGEARLAHGLGKSSNVTATIYAGQESTWTTTHRLADSGRTVNQRQFAIEALRLFRCVLAPYLDEHETLRV